MTSTTNNFSRQLRRAIVAVVPPAPRAACRRWYERTILPAAIAAARFEPRTDRVDVVMTNGPSFTILPECRFDVEAHFAANHHGAELAAFTREARRAGLLFDIGANNGLFSVLFCRLSEDSRAVAFEPSELSADQVRRMAAMNGIEGQLTCVAQAVGDRPGSAEMLIDLNRGFVQTNAFAGTEQYDWRTVTVSTTTVDDQAALFGSPSLLKIDVEGFEWEVLSGARETLERARPIVCLELHLNYLESRGRDPRSVLELLTSSRYALFQLSGEAASAGQICRSWAGNTHLVARPIERVNT